MWRREGSLIHLYVCILVYTVSWYGLIGYLPCGCLKFVLYVLLILRLVPKERYFMKGDRATAVKAEGEMLLSQRFDAK